MELAKAPATPEKFKNLLLDLGKPTKRGIRSCPKCGVKNGTRGLSCKNKNCEHVFKEGGKKKGNGLVAVKVITGSNIQVYSVRMRDRGPDYRAFVQLPMVQDVHGNPAQNLEPALLQSVLSSTAKCYVDACIRARAASTSLNSNPCAHVKSAIQSTSEATVLPCNMLHTLRIEQSMQQAILDLDASASGPLVQRISSNVMAVKCKPTNKKPMGFLHVFFVTPTKLRTGFNVNDAFICSCKDFKVGGMNFPSLVSMQVLFSSKPLSTC